jgi:hypothetical protein
MVIIYAPVKFQNEKMFQIKASINFTQVTYGLLNFPFLAMAMPFFVNYMTNARPTAYDSEGNCVPAYTQSYMYIK